jgi:threonine aldolase
MLAAMATAELGDEQVREDPTVNELQRRMAEILGKEASLFLPTATMANQIALRVLSKPGAVLLAEERTHVLIYEAGGPAIHSGLMTIPVPGMAGRITPEQVRAPRLPDGSVVVLENTHRTVWTQHVDSVTICFSKGLGCPCGAILAGSADFIEQAWEGKFLFGGALRQAGVIAAAMLYAIDHNIDRLAEDHARAKRLAEGLYDAGLAVDVDAVETNFVGVQVEDTTDARERAEREGVILGVLRPGVLRVATHLGVTDDDIDFALAALPRALGALARA